MRPKYSGSILIIEDTRFINSYLKEAFEYRGFSVSQAYTLAEAESILAEKSFDYIVLDLVLPDGDGEKIIATHGNIKTIVLTSDDDSQRRERLFQLGAIDYFSKENPIDYIIKQIDQLFEKLEANHQFHILVVDDSSSVRYIVCDAFIMRNFRVTGAESGKKALELVAKEKFDLILLDLHMPDVSGEDVLYAIRHEKKLHDLPVIIVSGTSDSDMIARILKHGANEFIRKPFSFEELVLKAEIFISMSRTEKIIEKKNKELEEMNTNLKEMVEREIDKRKTQEQELIFNARMVELGEMIGAITHQWMQPLNALSISMQDFEDVFQHDELDSAYVKDFLERSYNQIDFMSKTIKDFRNFYKKDNEEAELFPVEEVVDEVLNLIRGILKKKSIHVHFQFDPENMHFAYGHANEFRHVILNIVNNSKDAILNQQNALGKIVLNVNRQGEFIEVSISDNGGGVPEHNIENIFKPYFTTKGNMGTGIGLSISKTIIEEHFKGKIVLENFEEGARFSIFLPLPKN